MKLLYTVTLVYIFLLSLLDDSLHNNGRICSEWAATEQESDAGRLLHLHGGRFTVFG